MVRGLIAGLVVTFWISTLSAQTGDGWGFGAAKPTVPPPTPPVVVVPDTLLPPVAKSPWSGNIEAGVNGAEGNSQLFRVRTAGALQHKTDTHNWTWDWLYGYTQANDILTEDRLFTITRYEWIFGTSPWGLFWDFSLEKDQFKAFDLRLATHAGVTYKFIDDGVDYLRGRAGFGVSREIGGPENRFNPELIFGIDYEHKFSDKTKFVFNVDYLPTITDFSDYQLRAKAFFETMLMDNYNISLRCGIQDFFDSTPHGRKANDIEYFATVVWKF